MQKVLMLLICAMAFSAPAFADCMAESTAARPHLIELYSSERCSSCPPAEKWLRSVHTSADAVPLEFHVDYWDQLGWRDRFDDARYTARQQSIAARDGGTSIYTPQVVLDGRSWAGWSRGGRLPAAIPASASIILNVHPGAVLHVQVSAHTDDAAHALQLESAAAASRLQTYVALVEDGLTSEVRAGENRGATLHHDHVVRAFAGPFPLATTQFDLPVPADVDQSHASLVAFAQNPSDGKIAQVVSLSLTQCR
jgi:hypothetical protein